MRIRYIVLLSVLFLSATDLTGYTLTISKGGTGNGHITVNGTSQTLPFSKSYAAGTHLTVEAVPATGSKFDDWSGAGMSGTTNPISFNMPAVNINAWANFSLVRFSTYTLTVNKSGSGSGSIVINGVQQGLPYTGNYLEGVNITLKAVPASGSRFSFWSPNPYSSTLPEISLTMPNSNLTLYADFEIAVTLYLTKGGKGNGQISVDFTTVSTPVTLTYNIYTQVLLWATADPGSIFSGWTGDLTSNENPIPYILGGNRSVQANFNVSTYMDRPSVESFNDFRLMANYPNPFNSRTTIEYELMKQAEVTLAVCDVNGRCVKTLIHEIKNRGVFRSEWEGTDDAGFQAPSGIYFYRLIVKTEDGVRVFTKKMLMLE